MTNRLDAATRAALANQWARTTPADDDAELGDVETVPPPARPKVLAAGEEPQLLTKPNVQQLLSRPRIIAVGEEPPPLEPQPSRNGRQRKRGDRDSKGDKAHTPKGKMGERFATLNTFVDFGLADLSRADIAVWLVLYRDTREGTARTSYDDLARRAGLNRRTVGRALQQLQARGLVQIVHKGGLRRGMSRYRVRGAPKDG